jgi:hypothetical protein
MQQRTNIVCMIRLPHFADGKQGQLLVQLDAVSSACGEERSAREDFDRPHV